MWSVHIVTVLGVAALLMSLAVLVILSRLPGRRRGSREDGSEVSFLLDGTTLIEASPAGRHLLGATAPDHDTLRRLQTLLYGRFPGLGDAIGRLGPEDRCTLPALDDPGRLVLTRHAGLTRIVLEDKGGAEAAEPQLDRHAIAALRQELSALRDTAEGLPHPLWREDDEGRITWANRAYLDLCDRLAPTDGPRPWPPPQLFDLAAAQADPGRLVLDVPEGGETIRHWFDVTRTPVEDGALVTATRADALARAEAARGDFLATFGETFAALPIGLAIFDRSRDLALFNPALVDLTGLPAGFLCARPQLSDVLDRLRAARLLPEPKDYKSWRLQVAELVSAARSGTFEQRWTLPDGRTFRVTGRPHPDGALALLVEDVSAEVSIGRRFRSELALGQATLDALPDAVAIFGADGALIMTNAALDTLFPAEEGAPPPLVPDAAGTVDGWAAQCLPGPAWPRLRHMLTGREPRCEWRSSVLMNSGRRLSCRVVPLAEGATMVLFSARAARPRSLVALPQSQPRQALRG